MATYLYNAQASGANNGSSWPDAYTTFAAAVAAATVNGDVIKFHKTSQETLAANTTYTFLANISVICVDKDNGDAPAEMGTGGWIGTTSSNFSITLAGAKTVSLYGMTLREGGSSVITVNNTDGGHFELENCRLWYSSTAVSADLQIGSTTNQYTKLNGCTIDIDRPSNNSAKLQIGGQVEILGGKVEAASAPTGSFFNEISSAASQVSLLVMDCDLSSLGTQPLVGNSARSPGDFKFARCKMPSNWVLLATQTLANLSAHRALAVDSDSGDAHGTFRYADAFGSIVTDTATYFTAGAAQLSWRITTTANCSANTPFCSPPLPVFRASGASLTPYLEILRNDGSASALNDNDIWATFSGKVTSGFTLGTRYSDRMALLGTPAGQAAGAGTGVWTIGAANSPWSGKIDAGSSLTLAENGSLVAGVCVGKPSQTVYIDPFIRG